MNLYKKVLLLSFIFVCKSGAVLLQSQREPTNRIVGGQPAEKYEIPYQVSLRFRGSHICGGSLLTMKYVLTAAHCLYTEMNTSKWRRLLHSELTIFAGDINIKGSNGKIRKVSKLFIHPGYKVSTLNNDVAVLKLKNRFNVSEAINSIRLRNESIDYSKDILCLVSGWGSDSIEGKLSSRLMKVQIPVQDHTVCKKIYNDSWIDSKMICAGYTTGGKDSCKGDSGGPLVCENQLTGIVSFGKDCGLEYLGVYMDVFKYRSWIINTVNNGCILSQNINLCVVIILIVNAIHCLKSQLI